MHPALALWIWTMAMARAWHGSFALNVSPPAKQPKISMHGVGASGQLLLVPASEYLYSDVAQNPLPDKLLDRLADLYWTERDAELGV
ncbi:MAG: hypothetical protein JSR99_10090 [Proteobacteria bacterium]|nr:hypothetical protein [Pseudomonadota bacterium]